MMMKTCTIVIVSFLMAVCPVAAQVKKGEQAELRPAQKIMRARANWMKAMGEAAGAGTLADVGMNAEALASQTRKAAGNLEGEKKDLTLKVSALAKQTAEAAGMGDADAVKTKLGEIKAVCGECHAKYRDKK